MSYFTTGRQSGPSTDAAQLTKHLFNHTKGQPSRISPEVGSKVIAMEGLSDGMQSQLSDALSNFMTVVRAGMRVKPTLAQEHAAEISAVLASNAAAYASRPSISADALRTAAASTGVPTLVVPAEGSVERLSMEAFDNQANTNALQFSTSYNANAAKQDEAGELFFPTVTIGPNEVGFEVIAEQVLAYSDVSRHPSGSLNAFNRKNIIRAIIDATILANDQTKLIPVFRSSGANDSSANFVAGIAATTVTPPEGGASFQTKPLAIGRTFSLLGISQTDATLAAGQFDQTDAVDSSVRLAAIYLRVTAQDAQDSNTSKTEYFKLETLNMPTSDFNAAPQGNSRLLTLRFQTKGLKLTKDTKTTAGATSALLDVLSTNTVRLGVTVTGDVTQDTGDCTVNTTPVSIVAVNDAAGVDVTAGSAGTTAAAILADMAIVGYDLLAYRTNSNIRSRGKLLDTQQFKFLYTMPLLPPLTALRPVKGQDINDGSTVSKLVAATRTQAANAAITAILKTRDTLEAYAEGATAEVIANNPALFGAAALYVTPAYRASAINCATDLDSLTQGQRAADLTALLYNRVRDEAARLFVESGYGPALLSAYEGQMPKVTVMMLVDPVIHRYLTINGDTRLLGDQFDYKIAVSYDSRVEGKIFFSFGLESALGSGVVNVLHFGNMGYRPELTLMLPMVRGGSQVMELTVQPSFRHVTHLPILGQVTVSNIETVIAGKVAINNRPVS